MACGCKAKQNVTYVDPRSNKVQTATVPVDIQAKSTQVSNSNNNTQLQQQQELYRSGRTYIQIAKSLDTSSTTAPDQLCFNCIRKHLGMAYMFYLQKNTAHTLASLAQLMCVVTHLKDTHPNLAYMVRDKVILLMRKGSVSLLKETVQQLIQQFQINPQGDLPQYFPLPSIPEEQQLLTIFLINALLFVQITYQEVNKTWATAQLSFLSYNIFRTQNSLKSYETYRPLWKLIQSMQPLDQNYLAARDYLQSLLASKLLYYQQIVLPKHKEQFQQDYAKQKELMQNLQQQKDLPQAAQ